MTKQLKDYKNINLLRAKFLNVEDPVKPPLLKIEFQDSVRRFVKYFTSYYSARRYITENPSYAWEVKEGQEHMEEYKLHHDYELGGEA